MDTPRRCNPALVYRDVSGGIASIVKPMQALGQGDLSVDIPHRGEKTEIGLMADALQVFKEALIAKKAADEAAACRDHLIVPPWTPPVLRGLVSPGWSINRSSPAAQARIM